VPTNDGVGLTNFDGIIADNRTWISRTQALMLVSVAPRYDVVAALVASQPAGDKHFNALAFNGLKLTPIHFLTCDSVSIQLRCVN
jgi:hypothetical protein